MDRPKVHWDVPKDHSKFFYKVAFNAVLDRQSYILLRTLPFCPGLPVALVES